MRKKYQTVNQGPPTSKRRPIPGAPCAHCGKPRYYGAAKGYASDAEHELDVYCSRVCCEAGLNVPPGTGSVGLGYRARDGNSMYKR